MTKEEVRSKMQTMSKGVPKNNFKFFRALSTDEKKAISEIFPSMDYIDGVSKGLSRVMIGNSMTDRVFFAIGIEAIHSYIRLNYRKRTKSKKRDNNKNKRGKRGRKK